MEKEAWDNDPGYIAAKEKYAGTIAAWDALQVQVDAAAKLEPGYPAAREALDEAEKAMKQAREQLAAIQKARQVEAEELLEKANEIQRRRKSELRGK
jgi:hypothetical protein